MATLTPPNLETLQTLTLERLQFGCSAEIDGHTLADRVEASVDICDHAARKLVIALRAVVWAKRATRERHEWPATWWDAVKLRFFAAWMLQRWPARMSFVVIETQVGFPDAQYPTLGREFRYQKTLKLCLHTRNAKGFIS